MIRKKQIFKAFTLPVFLLIIEREVSKERTKDMKQRKHRYQFPDGFLWGSSTSGPQSEGTVPGDGKGPSNWDYWFSIESAKFHHQIGPEKPQPFMKTIRVTLPF